MDVVKDIHTGKQYFVKSECTSCLRSGRSIGEFDISWVFNIGSRKLHMPSWYHEERTQCGKDATGKTWLWQQ